MNRKFTGDNESSRDFLKIRKTSFYHVILTFNMNFLTCRKKLDLICNLRLRYD